MRFTKGRHAFIVCAHTDRAHIHNHVVWNSTSLDCSRKFRNFIGSAFALRRVSDHLCVEHGLSIVKNPAPSRGNTYGKWLGDDKPLSHKQVRREAVAYSPHIFKGRESLAQLSGMPLSPLRSRVK